MIVMKHYDYYDFNANEQSYIFTSKHTVMNITNRVALVRAWMQSRGIRRYIVPTIDPHNSEYVPAHWQCREWLTGFDGSAGTAVLTADGAWLYTDSRYWIQAAEQLKDTPFTLVRDDRVTEEEGDVVYDPREWPDPFDQWWEGRPAFPLSKAWKMSDETAGESAESKLRRLVEYLRDEGEEQLLVEELSEVAWTLNLRGDDIPYNPFLIAFLLVRADGCHTLYINKEQIPADIEAYLAGLGVTLAPYEDAPRGNGVKSPVGAWRNVKNAAEADGFRRAHEQDGVAMVRFLRWLQETDVAQLTELDIDARLTALRAESPDYLSLSFGTIAAYGPHGAIVHYEATEESAARLAPSGLLLLDSGAHYRTGTTDITRTLALGTLTEEERSVYTLVLKGHLQLQNMRFPEGTTGLQLDTAVRMPLWRAGLDFGHGTGHGVGHVLGVHEGPHQIRKNVRDCTLLPFRAGQTMTDEPGVYLEGRFGVRIENMLLSVEAKTGEFTEGNGSCNQPVWLEWEPLTLCPYDLRPVMPELLTPDEKNWLNAYHEQVRSRLLPLLPTEEDRQWLIEATEAI